MSVEVHCVFHRKGKQTDAFSYVFEALLEVADHLVEGLSEGVLLTENEFADHVMGADFEIVWVLVLQQINGIVLVLVHQYFR